MTGFGAYGKMPALGDFFRIALNGDFVTPWDAWLSSILASSKTNLGARWDSCYMSAPIWRFSLAPGLAGPKAMLGVLMVSVDRVGRKFPLTLAGETNLNHAQASFTFEALETTALGALEDDMTRALLSTSLADIPLPKPAQSTPKGASWSSFWDGADLSFDTPNLPNPTQALRLFDPASHFAKAAP